MINVNKLKDSLKIKAMPQGEGGKHRLLRDPNSQVEQQASAPEAS